MALLKNLDSTDLAILRVVGNNPGIKTTDICRIVYLGRTQVLRRLNRLSRLDFVTRKNSISGRTDRWSLTSTVAPDSIESYDQQRRLQNEVIQESLLIRETLVVLLDAMEQLGKVAQRLKKRFK